MNISGKTIIITGAASGIGRALAIACASSGASLALADINIASAHETRSCLDLAPSQQCTVHQLDVSNLKAWEAFRREVIQHHESIDGIINNAGVTCSGTVEDLSYQQINNVMSVNFMGMVYGSKEFLALLKERPEAFIANVSSVFGLYPLKNQSAYCASKFAIRGFTEVLAQELKGSNITVSCIHPGHIGTDIVENARRQGNIVSTALTDQQQAAWADAFKQMGLSPEEAANIILEGIRKKKRKITVGRDAKRDDRLSRLFPSIYIDAVNRAAP